MTVHVFGSVSFVKVLRGAGMAFVSSAAVLRLVHVGICCAFRPECVRTYLAFPVAECVHVLLDSEPIVRHSGTSRRPARDRLDNHYVNLGGLLGCRSI
jgi:hypothetical protein